MMLSVVLVAAWGEAQRSGRRHRVRGLCRAAARGGSDGGVIAGRREELSLQRPCAVRASIAHRAQGRRTDPRRASDGGGHGPLRGCDRRRGPECLRQRQRPPPPAASGGPVGRASPP